MAKKYPREIMYNKPPGRKKLDGTDPHSEAEDPTVYLQAKITQGLKDAFIRQCAKDGRTMSDVLRELIEKYITEST